MPTADLLRCYAPRPDARLRLVCFPHAGSTAGAYARWAATLPENLEVVAVDYPGRGGPATEAPAVDMNALAAAIREALLADTGRPYAFFGHSMGAAVAHETARALREVGAAEPERLVVSGREAPQYTPEPKEGDNTEEAALVELEHFGGTPPELLDDPEARALFLPRFLADRRLLHHYRPTGGRPLTCPVSAMVGSRDLRSTIAQAEGWSAVTTGPFDLTVFPGAHFYLLEDPGSALDAVAALTSG
jgi:pyochelin biosynthesis protein PchC